MQHNLLEYHSSEQPRCHCTGMAGSSGIVTEWFIELIVLHRCHGGLQGVRAKDDSAYAAVSAPASAQAAGMEMVPSGDVGSWDCGGGTASTPRL